jgi:hypothetical protein
VELSNRTLLDEWTCVRPCSNNAERVGLRSAWLHGYTYHRAPHRARRTPTDRECQQPLRELQLAELIAAVSIVVLSVLL